MKENVKIFLLSGLLEEYVMGLTSPDQNIEIERYIAEYEEVRAEYERFQDTIKAHAESIAVPPSNEVREHILSRAKKESNRRVSHIYKHLAIASALLFLLSTSFAIRYYVTSERLAASNLSMQLAIEELKTSQIKRDGIQIGSVRLHDQSIYKDIRAKKQ